MNALYIIANTSGPDPVKNNITQLAALLRRDGMSFVDIDHNKNPTTVIQCLHHLLPLVQESIVLIFYGLPSQLDFLIAESVRLRKPKLFQSFTKVPDHLPPGASNNLRRHLRHQTPRNAPYPIHLPNRYKRSSYTSVQACYTYSILSVTKL